MPVIKLDLSTDGINRALEELKAYGESVKTLDERVVKRLVNDGVEQAQDLVPLDTGALMSSIVGESNGKQGVIRTDCDYAAFVEFGTGVVGAAASYPGPLPAEYTYNGGEHHVILKDGRDGWFFPLDDGSWRFTQGQPTKPFMYDTAHLLAEAVPQIVEEELQS